MDYKEQDIRENGGLTRAPFAGTDAKRREVRQATSSGHPTIDQLNNRLQSFIQHMHDSMSGVSGHLENHAEALYGPVPISPENITTGDSPLRDYGTGHYAFTQESLDTLERLFDQNMARLAQAAGRNTTLA